MANDTLESIAEVVMGQSPPGKAVSATKVGLPLLNGPTEFGGSHPIPVQFTTDVRKQAFQGDLLFCVRGSTTGRMNWADQEYAIGRGIAAIRHRESLDFQPYVRAVIEYCLNGLLAQATGSTFPNVSATQLKSISFPRLGTTTQRAIAHILGSLDDKIELNRQMNCTLEKMAKAIFKSWFIDFDPVLAKADGRDTGLPNDIADLFPNSFEDSDLGEIPKGWVVKTIGEISQKISKGTTPRKKDVLAAPDGSSVPFLKVRNISNDGAIAISALERIPRSIHEGPLKRSMLKKGDVLFSIAGTIGRVTILPDDLDDSNANQAIAFVRMNDSNITSDFVRLLFLSKRIQHETKSKVVQGVQANVSLTVLSELLFACPNSELLVTWRRYTRTLFEKLAYLDVNTRTLRKARDTLLPKLISGEIIIPDVEKVLESIE